MTLAVYNRLLRCYVLIDLDVVMDPEDLKEMKVEPLANPGIPTASSLAAGSIPKKC